MQEGIGRTGYRLLVTLGVGLGVLGLLTTVYALRSDLPRGSFFDWLGICLNLFGLASLYGCTLWMLRRGRQAQSANATAAMVPAGAPVFTPQSTPPRQVDFEFKVEAKDDEPESDDGDAVAVPMREGGRPAARQAPKVVLPPNRNVGRDTKGWPQRSGPTGVTRGEWRSQQTGAPSPRAPRSVSGSASMLEPDPGVPIIIARIGDPKDDPDWTPQGMARGKCGGCNAILLAPPERPIRLRCPKCEKETLLR